MLLQWRECRLGACIRLPLFLLPTQTKALSAALWKASEHDSLPQTNLIRRSTACPLLAYSFRHIAGVQMRADPVCSTSTCVVNPVNFISTNFIIYLLMSLIKIQAPQLFFRASGLVRSRTLENVIFHIHDLPLPKITLLFFTWKRNYLTNGKV